MLVHPLKGHQDWTTLSRVKGGVKIATNPETPCSNVILTQAMKLDCISGFHPDGATFGLNQIEVPANANMGCNLISFPPRSPSMPHCGPLQTAMLFSEIGRFTRAAEEGGDDTISQARGEITDITPTGCFQEFINGKSMTSSTL